MVGMGQERGANGLASPHAVPSWRDHVVEPLRDPNPSDLLEVRVTPWWLHKQRSKPRLQPGGWG